MAGEKITLRSWDGKEFEVEKGVAMESKTIRDAIEVVTAVAKVQNRSQPEIEDGCAENVFTLHNFTSPILSMVIEYCKKHVDAAEERMGDDEIKAWDAKFVEVNRDNVNEDETDGWNSQLADSGLIPGFRQARKFVAFWPK